ncbi:hypothetical protein [Streptomyces sp. PR69]|uniref:hypothetical protein n=1 Tax=Streptomyces sp. PR69 TaxID=2984950 RepID=UPI002265088D|nr:hypothetical protein [Streptomyces sp. PR69]
MRSGLIALRGAGVAGVLIIAPAGPAAYAADPVKATPTPAALAPGGEVEVRVTGCPEARGTVSSKAFVADAELAADDGARTRLIGSTTVKSTVKVGAYEIQVDCGGREHPKAGRIEVVHRYAQPHPSRQPGQSQKPDLSQRPERPERSERPEGADPAKDSAGRPQRPDPPGPAQDRLQDRSAQDQLADRPGQSGQPRPSAGGPQASPRPASPVAPVRAGGGGTATLAGGQAAEQPSARPDVAETGPSTPHTVIGLVLAGVAAIAVAFRSSRRRRPGAD